MRSLVSLASLAVAAQPELYPKLSTLPVSVQAQLLRHLVKFAEGLSPSIFSFCDSTTLHLDSNLCNDEVVNALADAPLKTEILALEKADYSLVACRRLALKLQESLSSLDLSQSLRFGLLNAFSKCALLRQVKCDDSLVRDREVQMILQKCVLLQELSLRRCHQLTDKAFARMKRNYLLRLDVREVRNLTDVTLERIAVCCPTLLDLSLEGQKIVGSGLRAVLDACCELKSLAIPLVGIDSPDTLLRIRNTSVKIRQLDLFGSVLPEATLLFLFGNVFRNLKKLNASGVRNLSKDVFKYLVKRSPKLESLSLKGHLTRVDDSFLEVIQQNLTCLVSIDLSLCRAISNEGLLRLFKALPMALKCVNLISLPVLRDDVVIAICESSGPRLEKLALGGNHLISNAGAAVIASQCKRLRSLCLKGCSIDDSSLLMKIVSNNPLLQMVSLSGVKGVTDDVLSCVARECPEIHDVFLSGVPVSRSAISKFRFEVGRDVQVYGKRMKPKKVV